MERIFSPRPESMPAKATPVKAMKAMKARGARKGVKPMKAKKVMKVMKTHAKPLKAKNHQKTSEGARTHMVTCCVAFELNMFSSDLHSLSVL